MPFNEETIELDLPIRRPPESVRAWWTDLPDDYHATDPREQPYRIVTKNRTPTDRELVCYWRSPDGSERQTQETLHLNKDGSWAFDVVHPAGFLIRDEFRAVPAEGSTRLEIRSKITQSQPNIGVPIQKQKELMAQLWRNMVEICERDAPIVA